MTKALEIHRAARAPLPPAQILAIRNACPAAEGRETDLDTARLLIRDPAAYAAALLPPLSSSGQVSTAGATTRHAVILCLTTGAGNRMFCGSRGSAMAKTNTVQIKLVSSADTGFFYVTKKNARTQTGKLELKKYDPVVRKHVPFRETKIK